MKQGRYSKSQESATSLYPYYLVYVSKDGNIHITNTNAKKLLDIYKALCESKTKPIEDLISLFNRETKNGSDMREYTYLLEKAVADIKGVVEQKGVMSLFQMGDAALFDNSVSSAKDFELISFLVVK